MRGFTIEKKFLSLGLIFGLLLVFLVPPLQVADEDSHFKKSYLVASLKLFPEVNADGRVGNYIPQAIMDFDNNQRYLMGNADARYSYKNQYLDSHVQVSKRNEVFVEYSTSMTNPILFIPQAIGMFFMKVTIDNPIFNLDENFSPINYLYAGRITNLLFYLLCCFWAIKVIPILKNTLFLLCLMPMSFSLAASLSYDGIITGMIFLFVSLIFKACYDGNFANKSKPFLVSLVVFSIILIQFKQIYYPIFLLFLLIPDTKFESRRNKMKWFGIIVFAGVLSYAGWSLLLKCFTRKAVSISPSLAMEQVKFIISSPFDYLHIFLSSVYNNLEFYFVGFIGNLGWLDTNFPYVFIYIYFLLLVISVIFDNSEYKVKINYKHRLTLVLISFAIVALIETALYVIWTSVLFGVGYHLISGVQGRYFIPISLIVFATLKTSHFSDKIRKIGAYDIVDFIIPKMALFSLALTLIILLFRYWIPIV